MNNTKNKKHALLSSILALFLCFSMLLGTTYAWFTDSVTSKNNIITAGNLDVELYYQTEEVTTWTKVDETTNVFKENVLWEPGHAEVVKLKVVNEGSLALKYQLSVNVVRETEDCKNVAGEEFKLSNFIDYGIVCYRSRHKILSFKTGVLQYCTERLTIPQFFLYASCKIKKTVL